MISFLQGDLCLALTREVNLATPSSAPSAEEIRESVGLNNATDTLTRYRYHIEKFD